MVAPVVLVAAALLALLSFQLRNKFMRDFCLTLALCAGIAGLAGIAFAGNYATHIRGYPIPTLSDGNPFQQAKISQSELDAVVQITDNHLYRARWLWFFHKGGALTEREYQKYFIMSTDIMGKEIENLLGYERTKTLVEKVLPAVNELGARMAAPREETNP